ncbi:MAG TPA: PAS domain S-box protein [Gammaproteobacteria bacterium]|nr:PAS domain S-box protein [Gammaproteobacteria bacterium]
MPEPSANSNTAAPAADPAAGPTEFDAFMAAAVDAIVVIEATGEIVAFSRSAEKMFGYAAAEVVGKQVSLLMPEPYRSAHPTYMEHYRATGVPHIIGSGREVEAVRSDGGVFPVWLSVGESKTDSRHRFVGIIRDLTEQHAAEFERHALETRLEQVSRLSLLGEMAAGIAHEINQPLTAIANYSDAAHRFLERGDADADMLRSACDGIAEQVHRAGDVITNLRDFVRRRKIERKNIDLRKLIDGVMVLIEADAAHEGVAVEKDFADALPEISGNAVQLQQVLLNLTRNAVDAMRGGLRRQKSLNIATGRSGDGKAEIRVSDRGPGVSASLEEAIFHPFFTTKPDGLGVGLAISRSIVDAHGGELRYEPRDGGGATFVISLPALTE